VKKAPAGPVIAAVLALVATLLTLGGAAATATAQVSPTAGLATGPDPYFPADGNSGYDVRHYDVHDRIAPRVGLLTGWTLVTAVSGQELTDFYLDLVLDVDRVAVNGVRVRFSKPNRHELRVHPATPIAAVPSRSAGRASTRGSPAAAR
jgi:hypothetical protein